MKSLRHIIFIFLIAVTVFMVWFFIIPKFLVFLDPSLSTIDFYQTVYIYKVFLHNKLLGFVSLCLQIGTVYGIIIFTHRLKRENRTQLSRVIRSRAEDLFSTSFKAKDTDVPIDMPLGCSCIGEFYSHNMEFRYLDFANTNEQVLECNLHNLDKDTIDELNTLSIIYFHQPINEDVIGQISFGKRRQLIGTKSKMGNKETQITWEVI